MHSSLIGKIEKARRYAEERDRRIAFEALTVRFRGENDEHEVSLNGARWSCTCDFFDGYGTCCHTMALERVLDGMLPREAREQALPQIAAAV
ncbi:MAG: SWIM zinc finger family protein [Dehalococcoidia bacterium]